VEICDGLRGAHGSRFEAPGLLRKMASEGGSFYGAVAARAA